MLEIERFVTAVESIAASLAVIAAFDAANTPEAEQAAPPKPAAPAAAATPSRGRGRPSTKDAAPAAAAVTDTKVEQARTVTATKVEQATPAAQVVQAAAAPATPVEVVPDFDYETLKGVVVELINIGSEGKSAAINVLTKHGVKKASEAAPAEWPKIHADMLAELALLQGGGDLT